MQLHRILLALPLILSVAAAEPLQPLKRGDPQDPLNHYGWLRELAGSCWQGTADGKPEDVRCFETQFGIVLRETMEKEVESGKKKTVLKTDRVLAWDGVTGNIEIFSWSSDGSFRTGEATLWKGAYRFLDRPRDGKPPEFRTIWRRPSPETFEVSLERTDGTRWFDVKVVTYERVKR
jgi:hypothetical protein